MEVISIPLKELRKPEKNLRLHTDVQLNEFVRSVNMFGQIRPIVVDENNVMLAGNGLYDALRLAGYTEADCYMIKGLTEKQKKKLMLADNRIFDLGVDDLASFDSFIAELGDDLDVPGFDEDLLKSLMADTASVTEMMSDYGIVPEDRAKEIRETRERYKERDAAAARNATEYTTAPAPADEDHAADHDGVQAVRDMTGYTAPYKADESERRYILCPECEARIWL